MICLLNIIDVYSDFKILKIKPNLLFFIDLLSRYERNSAETRPLQITRDNCNLNKKL